MIERMPILAPANPKNGSGKVNRTEQGAAETEQRRAGGPPQDPQAEYADVRNRIHGLVDCLIDRGSTVAVVSKGDQSSQGWHFPRTTDGKYAGHHPADGTEAIAHLEQLRGQGADFFLLPSTYFWWLGHYEALAEHLRSQYRLVADCPDTCLIYDLRSGAGATRSPVAAPRTQRQRGSNGAFAPDPLLPAIRALLDSLLPDDEPVLVVSEGNEALLRLGRKALDFPVDRRGEHRSISSIGQDAIAAQLTDMRARGLRYLVVPDTARQGLGRSGALRKCRREVAIREGICAIYELENAERTRPEPAGGRLRRLFRRNGGPGG
jgi:hypothetical protein